MTRGTDPSFFDEAVRAVSGYYGRLGRIGLDLAAIVIPLDQLRDAASRLPVELSRLDRGGLVSDDADVAPHPSGDPATSRARTVTPSPTLVVESDGDRPGLGAFMVENLTADPVSAPIQVSGFVDDRGHEVRPKLGLWPSTVTLGPGEQAVVRLAARIDDALEPGVAYRGEIAIPGLSEQRIPVVLLRRIADRSPGVDVPTESRSPTRRGNAANRQAATPKTATPKTARRTATKGTAKAPRVTASNDDAR